MFKIYDLNMKELPFPEGVKPLDIFVSSVNKRRITEEFEGRSGTLNYGYDYGERSVDLSLWLEAHDTIDYRLIRNELYAFFDTHDVFYVEETRVPSRVLKVTIDESYIPERINQTHSSVEISCRTLDSVFWESKYTTLELHDSGYSATAEKYGLVDNIDDEKVEYRFEPETSYQNLSNEPFEYGFISSTNGNNSSHERYIRTAGYINLFEGIEYLFTDTGTGANVRAWWLYEYDSNNNFIRAHNAGGSNLSFVAQGTRLRLMADTASGNVIDINELGTGIRPRLSRSAMTNTFTVYNAGNVTIEPESMLLNIHANVVRSTNNFTIRNKTTGEEIVLKRASNGSHFRIRGMVISLGSLTNIFRETNRRFISLVPGDNEFEVLNGTFEKIRFEFKYLYK